MTPEHWTAVDQFICDHFVPGDDVLDAVLSSGVEAGLPSIQVSPNQGKLLQILVETLGAQRVLELGTLAGYRSIWMARALLPGGKLITLEAEPKHAEVARMNFAQAGLEKVIELRVGPALETLPQLAAEHASPFDLTFIDADKQHTAEYFDWAVRLSRPGGLIVVDNVVRKGAVLDVDSHDESVLGVQRFYEVARHDSRVMLTVMQTVGSKGYDGFALARVMTSGSTIAID